MDETGRCQLHIRSHFSYSLGADLGAKRCDNYPKALEYTHPNQHVDPVQHLHTNECPRQNGDAYSDPYPTAHSNIFFASNCYGYTFSHRYNGSDLHADRTWRPDLDARTDPYASTAAYKYAGPQLHALSC